MTVPTVPAPAARHVLVVDDDHAVRWMLVEALTGAGFRVHEARDGREALWKMGELPRPCALVLDVHMAGMDGPELLALLRQQGVDGDFPTVLISGVPTPPRGALAALPLMRKPLDVSALVDRVRALHRLPAASGG